MKKRYIKPVIMMESFQLDTAVAGTCRADAETQKKEYVKLGYTATTCSFDGQFFSRKNCQIDLAGPEEDGNDALCYHGPYTNKVFINS